MCCVQLMCVCACCRVCERIRRVRTQAERRVSVDQSQTRKPGTLCVTSCCSATLRYSFSLPRSLHSAALAPSVRPALEPCACVRCHHRVLRSCSHHRRSVEISVDPVPPLQLGLTMTGAAAAAAAIRSSDSEGEHWVLVIGLGKAACG